ncbi:MAG: LacI family transcriptional regulator [Conexibacteraceae bacterium]|nr:LacI family transcriptional regulator [Conexibacteraceae bacterium]
MSTANVKTIADLARLAGVSKATVSRALNDSPLVNAETRERVRALAGEHGFQMNDSARRLSLRQSNVIALVTYAYMASEKVPDAFMLEIMSGLTAGLHAEGYDLLVIQVDSGDSSWIARYLNSGRVDGFVVLAATCTMEHLRTLEQRGAPFVIWGMHPEGRTGSTVVGDGFTGGRLATEHLLSAGRRHIAFIGGPAEVEEVQDRYGGYAAALTAAGLPVDESLVAYGDFRPECGAATMCELLERRGDIDAVFVCSDLMAVTAIDELRAQGRSVPQDVAVIGYDDVAIAAHNDPPLTTVRQPGPLAGRLLAQTLIQQLRTGAVTHVSIPAELVVRASA